MTQRQGPLDVAIDNDLILKATCYGLARDFWRDGDRSLGILGAAKYVVGRRLDGISLARDRSSARAELASLMQRAAELEPTEPELAFAAEIEVAAQEAGLGLDAGESQLASVVIERGIRLLETGDKRAIGAMERLIDTIGRLAALGGKVGCLEQIVRGLIEEEAAHDRIAAAVCSEPQVDLTLTICFACNSPAAGERAMAAAGLDSYIQALRREAPRILVRSLSQEDGVRFDELG